MSFHSQKTSCNNKVKEPTLTNNLPISEGKVVGFISFLRVLCEMPTAPSRVWTRVTVSISDRENYHITITWDMYRIYYYMQPDIGMMVRVFANGPGDLGSIPGRVIPKTQKMVLDASLLTAITFTFGQIPLGKVWNPLSSQLWVK